jgi:hypothetical protein
MRTAVSGAASAMQLSSTHCPPCAATNAPRFGWSARCACKHTTQQHAHREGHRQLLAAVQQEGQVCVDAGRRQRLRRTAGVHDAAAGLRRQAAVAAPPGGGGGGAGAGPPPRGGGGGGGGAAPLPRSSTAYQHTNTRTHARTHANRRTARTSWMNAECTSPRSRNWQLLPASQRRRELRSRNPTPGSTTSDSACLRGTAQGVSLRQKRANTHTKDKACILPQTRLAQPSHQLQPPTDPPSVTCVVTAMSAATASSAAAATTAAGARTAAALDHATAAATAIAADASTRKHQLLQLYESHCDV